MLDQALPKNPNAGISCIDTRSTEANESPSRIKFTEPTT